MAEHRVRLTDEDVDVIVASLRARTAGISGMRRKRALWLATRLAEMGPGNPQLRFEGGNAPRSDWDASNTHYSSARDYAALQNDLNA